MAAGQRRAERARGIHAGAGEWPAEQDVQRHGQADGQSADLRRAGIHRGTINHEHQKEGQDDFDAMPGPWEMSSPRSGVPAATICGLRCPKMAHKQQSRRRCRPPVARSNRRRNLLGDRLSRRPASPNVTAGFRCPPEMPPVAETITAMANPWASATPSKPTPAPGDYYRWRRRR